MGDAEDEPAVRPQDPMEFAQRSVQPSDILEDHVRDDEIEGARFDRRKFREVALTEADPERVTRFVRLRDCEEPGDRSTPTTRAPCLARTRDKYPFPQPASRMRWPRTSPAIARSAGSMTHSRLMSPFSL